MKDNVMYNAIQISDDYSIVFLDTNKIAVTTHINLDKFDIENPKKYIAAFEEGYNFDQIINLKPLTDMEYYIRSGIKR